MSVPRLTSVLVLGIATACSSSGSGGSGGGGTCEAYTVPAGTDLKSPMTTFSGDVMPVFGKSCATSSTCHGSPTGTNNGVTLGAIGATPSAHDIRENLVGVPSKENPSMHYVAAGSPTSSYLMHKIDGDQCTADVQCTGAPPGLPPPSPASCQNSMPSGSPLLDVATRDVIRRWIAQGALDN